MRRREFITLLGGAATWALPVCAQNSAVPIVGFLHVAAAKPFAHRSAFDPKRTFVNIELRLGYPKSFFEGALEWMFMPTSERDDVGSLFLRQFVRIVTTLRGSLVMDEKHLLRSRVPIHVEEGFQDMDNELHRCLFII
jgi:hypothetical protein